MSLQPICAALADAFFPGCAVHVDMPRHMQHVLVDFIIVCYCCKGLPLAVTRCCCMVCRCLPAQELGCMGY